METQHNEKEKMPTDRFEIMDINPPEGGNRYRDSRQADSTAS